MSDTVIAVPAARGARPSPALASMPVMIARCVRLSRRNLDALITALVLPVLLMLMFVYLFGGAIATDGTAGHVRRMLDALDPRRVAVERFSVRGVTLDDVFLALTGDLPEQAGEAGSRTEHDRSDQKEVTGV